MGTMAGMAARPAIAIALLTLASGSSEQKPDVQRSMEVLAAQRASEPSMAVVLTGLLRFRSEKQFIGFRAQVLKLDVHVVTYLEYAWLARNLVRSRDQVVLIADRITQTGTLSFMPTNALQWYHLAVALQRFDFSKYDFVLRWRTDIVAEIPAVHAIASWFAGRSGVVLAWTDRAFVARPADLMAAYADMYSETCLLYTNWPRRGGCSGIPANGTSWRDAVLPDEAARYVARARAHPDCAGWRNGTNWWIESCGCRYDGLDECPWRYVDQPKPFASETAHTFHLARRGIVCDALVSTGRVKVLNLRPGRKAVSWGLLQRPFKAHHAKLNFTALAATVVTKPPVDCSL